MFNTRFRKKQKGKKMRVQAKKYVKGYPHDLGTEKEKKKKRVKVNEAGLTKPEKIIELFLKD